MCVLEGRGGATGARGGRGLYASELESFPFPYLTLVGIFLAIHIIHLNSAEILLLKL